MNNRINGEFITGRLFNRILWLDDRHGYGIVRKGLLPGGTSRLSVSWG